MLPAMVAVTLAVFCSIALASAEPPPRLVAHARIHSFSALEAMIGDAYAAQGFGEVYRDRDRFDELRALVGADVGDRPCAVAWVADATGRAHVVGVAPDALREKPLDHALARGADPHVCAFVEDLATSQRWLPHAADDDAPVRVLVDVAAVRDVWRDELGTFAAMVRSTVALRAMLAQSSPMLEQAVDVLDRSVCSLDAWSSLDVALGLHAGRLSARATLVPESGSAAEHGLRTWQPLRIPVERVAFDGADLQGFIGPSDVDVAALLCDPQATAVDSAALDRFARTGGVFAFGLEPDRVGLMLPYGEHPVGDPAWPVAWRAAATRCMSPLNAGDDIAADAVFVRARPAAWIANLYDRVDPRLTVPERSVDGWIEVRGRAIGGALELDVDADVPAIAAAIPCLRIP